MKYLKTFEMDSSMRRKPAYKFLSTENAEKIEVVIRAFIEEQNITDRISRLKLEDYIAHSFDYKEIFQSFVSGKGYSFGNIYYVIDTFCDDEGMIVKKPELRNSMEKLINKIFKELKIKNLLDKKLIKIFESKPLKYSSRFDIYEEELSDVVKKECKYILDAEKYNM